MKRLLTKKSSIIDSDLSLQTGLDNKKSEVVFESEGVKYRVEGDFSFSFDVDDENELEKSFTDNEVLGLIESTQSVDLAKLVNNAVNGYQMPEWQLPTKKEVNVWYTPKPLQIVSFKITNTNIEVNTITFNIHIICESELTPYNQLDIEKEEFKTYGIDPNDFTISKDIMTGEFYR